MAVDTGPALPRRAGAGSSLPTNFLTLVLVTAAVVQTAWITALTWAFFRWIVR